MRAVFFSHMLVSALWFGRSIMVINLVFPIFFFNWCFEFGVGAGSGFLFDGNGMVVDGGAKSRESLVMTCLSFSRTPSQKASPQPATPSLLLLLVADTSTSGGDARCSAQNCSALSRHTRVCARSKSLSCLPSPFLYLLPPLLISIPRNFLLPFPTLLPLLALLSLSHTCVGRVG